MSKSLPALRLTGFFLLMAILLLDQWSKAAIVKVAYTSGLPHDILPFFNLVLVHNHGISFGFFSAGATFLPRLITFFTSAVALGLFIWLLRACEWWVACALGLIIGGAVGNIIDRVRIGAVTDFLDFHVGDYHWPAFNVADSAIFIGVVILVLIGIVGPAKKKELS